MMDSETCPACGAMASNAGVVRSVVVNRCDGERCGLHFLGARVRPRAENDNRWYEEWLGVDDAQVAVAREGMAARYRRQLQMLGDLVDGREVLDVGSGLGFFLAEARDAGWHAVGLEASPHGREFSRQRLGVAVVGEFSEIAPASRAVVRASHVLEHIPEPSPFLAACREALAPNGLMLVIVPHREPLTERVINFGRSLRGNRELAGAVYPDMHVLGFDHRSLRNLMTRAGFETLSIRGVGMGDRTYYPWFYDDLVHVLPFRRWMGLGWRYCIPRVVNRVAAPFGRGDWIAGLFRKRD